MTPTERQKAIATAIAVAARNPFLANEIKVGLAAMAEELAELRAAIGNVCNAVERK